MPQRVTAVLGGGQVPAPPKRTRKTATGSVGAALRQEVASANKKNKRPRSKTAAPGAAKAAAKAASASVIDGAMVKCVILHGAGGKKVQFKAASDMAKFMGQGPSEAAFAANKKKRPGTEAYMASKARIDDINKRAEALRRKKKKK